MLVIVIKGKDDRLSDQVEWTLGMNKSMYAFGNHGTNLTLIGSGRELEWIRANITGIRMHRGDQVRWVGEDAIFIANALPKPEQLEGIWQCS
jgi:hypothetical protein